MCNANIICSFCWYLGGYIYTNRAWLFATPYYISAWCTLGGAAVSAAPTELLALLLGWCTLGGAVVPARLCRLPEQELHQQNCWDAAWLVHLRQVHPLKAPPERLLNEYFLHLAVSRANDVQTLLELRKLNAVNCEECCCALSYGCSVDAGF